MTKQPPVTQDRFRIHIETSLENMGPLFAQLTRMGIEKLDYELITDVAVWRQNGKREKPQAEPKPAGQKQFEVTGLTAIWNHVKSRKSFTTGSLRELFKEQGRNPASVSPLVDSLLKEKRVKRIAAGEYAPTKKKGVPKRQQHTASLKKANGASHVTGVSHG